MTERSRLRPPPSVLLVDDERLVRSLVARGLRQSGYEVTDVDSAEKALDVLADSVRSVDLLITDVHMPGIDGVHLARRARQMRPGLRVLLISASEEIPPDAAPLVDRLLLKPFRRPDLLDAVNEVLGRAP